VPVHLEPLQTVDISQAACEANRVLLTDEQLRGFPAADAAFRLLRSRLQNRLKQNNWFSLAIASASQGDGKTVTAVNLAISVAREKQRPVYLLDLDMRNPSVFRMLGIVNATPLPEYLLGHAKPEQVLFQTSMPSLVVAGASTPTASASELLASQRFNELLSHIRLRSRNALVIVDCPPVNLTDEALLIGPRVDAFLLVVAEGKTERKHLAQAMATLGEFTIAGIVVNHSSDSDTIEYSHYAA
jgi:capsular exopolysaccharide synthesis family protein